jgi:uncharacterized integral membrane protein
MNPSNSSSRDYTLDASQADGVRPVDDGSGPESRDATDTGPNAVVPVAGHRVVDQTPPGEAQVAEVASSGGTSRADRAPSMTRASAAWAALMAALLLAVVLIVFVMQNPVPVVIHFLGWSGEVAVGMALLIAAVTGGLLVATIGVARLTQLRVRAHRTRAVAR